MCEDTSFENLLKGMQTDYSAEASLLLMRSEGCREIQKRQRGDSGELGSEFSLNL